MTLLVVFNQTKRYRGGRRGYYLMSPIFTLFVEVQEILVFIMYIKPFKGKDNNYFLNNFEPQGLARNDRRTDWRTVRLRNLTRLVFWSFDIYNFISIHIRFRCYKEPLGEQTIIHCGNMLWVCNDGPSVLNGGEIIKLATPFVPQVIESLIQLTVKGTPSSVRCSYFQSSNLIYFSRNYTPIALQRCPRGLCSTQKLT